MRATCIGRSATASGLSLHCHELAQLWPSAWSGGHHCLLLSLVHAVQALMQKYMPFAVIIGIILFVLWARRAFY